MYDVYDPTGEPVDHWIPYIIFKGPTPKKIVCEKKYI